jgi:hypothetical protein
MGWFEKLKSSWNLFSNRDPTNYERRTDLGMASYNRPDRTRLNIINERSIIAAIETRIAVDVAQIDIRHVRLDEKKRYKEDIDSDLNNVLTERANKDQTARAFRQDIATSLIDEGCIAIVPVDTDDEIYDDNLFSIITARTGKILEWFPDNIRVEVYNDRTGRREQKIVPKDSVCIVENPFYPVMNEPNSTLKRLTRKLNMLDQIDELTSSGKLDIIIQFPWKVKGAAKRAEAEKRRRDMENQLSNSKYGVAYADADEKVTQLNRPAENNLMAQVKYLTDLLFSQLFITPEILNGTADENTLNNYYERAIEPIVSAITDEMKTKWLTKTARTRGQSIMHFRNPFKLMSASKIADVGGKLISSEVATKNEIRGLIGFAPSDDPEADKLINPNINKKGALNQQLNNTPKEETAEDNTTEEADTNV